MNDVRVIPAPGPVRRLLQPASGTAVYESLTVTVPFRIEQHAFRKIALETIGRFDAFRIVPVLPAPGMALSIRPGEAPEIVWLEDSPVTPPPRATRAGSDRDVNRVECELTCVAADLSRITLRAPSRCVDRRSLEFVLERIARGVRTGGAAESDEVSYFDIAAWLAGIAETEEGFRGRQYWRQAVPREAIEWASPAPVEPIEVLRDWTMPPHVIRLRRSERESLAALCWLQVARILTRQPPLAIGCLADGRLQEGLADAVGPLSRYVPFWLSASAIGSDEAFRAGEETLAEGREWQELFSPDADVPGGCFPCGFEYIENVPDRTIRVETSQSGDAPCLVLLRCEERGGLLHVTAESRHPEVRTAALAGAVDRWLSLFEHGLEPHGRRIPKIAHPVVHDPASRGVLDADGNGRPESRRSLLEAQLLEEWQQVLQRREVGVETNFMDDGGDSFAIMQLNLRLRRRFGVELPVVEMFRYTSIRSLACYLDTLGARIAPQPGS